MRDIKVKQLAEIAGISVRTLHYYDAIGLLRPQTRNESGYRYYSEEAVLRLQQILFFRELGFSLTEIKQILDSPGFNALEALREQRKLLEKEERKIKQLLGTVDRTIKKMRGELDMEIRDYYRGFSDEQIERYRGEVCKRWGSKMLEESEQKITGMGKQKFAQLQAEGGKLFEAVRDNMGKGFESPEVQEQIVKWRSWLENFAHYSDEAALGLGKVYSQDPEFAIFFANYHPDLARFLTGAIEYYFDKKKK